MLGGGGVYCQGGGGNGSGITNAICVLKIDLLGTGSLQAKFLTTDTTRLNFQNISPITGVYPI